MLKALAAVLPEIAVIASAGTGTHVEFVGVTKASGTASASVLTSTTNINPLKSCNSVPAGYTAESTIPKFNVRRMEKL